MKIGDAMIVLGCSIAAGFIGFAIAVVGSRGISEAGLLLFFGAPAISTALIASGILMRLNERKKRN